MRRFVLPLVAAGAATLLSVSSARAASPSIAFDGGTAAEQAQVRSALAASSFDWSVLPVPITVHIGSYPGSYATPGNVYFGASLLDGGQLSWGVVLHEFGHQVDFLLFNAAERAQLQSLLGAKDWCYETPGLQHSDHGCERFASEISWAFWPSTSNVLRPTGPDSESNGMPVAAFRALVAQMLGQPVRVLSAAPTAKRHR
jgi:hypothetical protein